MTRAVWLALSATAAALAVAPSLAQDDPSPPPAPASPAAETAPTTTAPATPAAPAGRSGLPAPMVVPTGNPAADQFPHGLELVSFHGPDEATFEIIGGAPQDVAAEDQGAGLVVGLEAGRSYRVKVANLPNRPDDELHIALELLGHLHRDPNADPTKYPLRVSVSAVDMEAVLDRSQLITQVIYLEDPDLAEPLTALPGTLPTVEVGPSEDPFLVARKLGRIMAVVRIGARRPSPEQLADDGLSIGLVGRCPYLPSDGGLCGLPCPPGCPPLRLGGPNRPKDEYLCDGGDREDVLRPGEPSIRGVDPQDAIVGFYDETDPLRLRRELPTNRVCVYAPRFARVVGQMGVDAAITVQFPGINETRELPEIQTRLQDVRPMTKHDALISLRDRDRPSELGNRQGPGAVQDMIFLEGVDQAITVVTWYTVEGIQLTGRAVGPYTLIERQRLEAIKTAESVVVAGIAEAAGQAEMIWTPNDLTAVEEPEARPGLAVVKQVDKPSAAAGDELLYVIRYKNVGNVAIRAVTITDSLLPRLQYIEGSARGPEGTVFTKAPNRAGSLELRWDLPKAIPPGEEGAVSFRVKVL